MAMGQLHMRLQHKPAANTATTRRCRCTVPAQPTRRSHGLACSATSSSQSQRVPDLDAGLRQSFAQQMQQAGTGLARRERRPGGREPLSEFFTKVQRAWRIFFPERPKRLTPREDVKQRLRMILVADRCGMSPASMSEMKKTICKALDDFVEIESEERVMVNVATEPEVGTVYYVAVPVRRVKPESRGAGEGAEGAPAPEGVYLEWDPENPESDPSGRFPYGT